MGHHHHLHNASDGVLQRVNSPRFSGAMTRRAHSFKRNPNASAAVANTGSSHSNNGSGSGTNGGNGVFGGAGEYEIDLQLNSPRSEIGNSVPGDGFDSVLERKQTHNHVSQRVAREKANWICSGGLGVEGEEETWPLDVLCVLWGLFVSWDSEDLCNWLVWICYWNWMVLTP